MVSKEKVQVMKVEEKDLIITDPCYISDSLDWGNSFDYDDLIIKDPHFSVYEWEETGYGDGSPIVFSIPSNKNPEKYVENIGVDDDYDREDLGECGVDSGSFGVFILEEALSYDPNFLESLPENCYRIIKNFTGTVYSGRDSKGYTHFILQPEDKTERIIITD